MTAGNRLVGVISLTCLGWTLAMPGPAVAQQIGAADYVIGPNDVLAITVFNQDKLPPKYFVGSDGTFTFPYIGQVSAGGLTRRAVENEIRDRLAKEFFKDPQVTVVVDQYRSQQVIVQGMVRQPQVLQFTGSMSLAEALARVGGPSEKAGAEVLVFRRSVAGTSAGPGSQSPPTKLPTVNASLNTNDPNVIRVNLEKLKTDPSHDVALQSGYTVSVLAAETVFVQGQVARTGEYPIRPGMTVQQVIVLAGGPTDLGSDRRIEIQRVVDGKKTTIKAKLDDPVLGGDIINVPKRWL